ncbi:MAG: S8 family serine peptidase [Chitinophagales bacterium]
MKPINQISVNLDPYQVVFPGASIVIDSKTGLDQRSIQNSVSVRDQKGKVKLSKDGRKAVWQADEKLGAGWHSLTIGELLTKKGEKYSVNTNIPFFVTDSKARVPADLAVAAMVRLKVNGLSVERVPAHQAPKGKFIEVMKAFDKKNGKPYELAFDETGKKVNHEQVLEQLEQNRFEKYGKLHPTLHDRFAKNGGRQFVAIWLTNVEKSTLPDKTKLKPYKAPAEETKKRMYDLTSTLARRISETFQTERVIADPAAPVVYAQLTLKEAQAIAKMKDVAGLFLYDPKGIEDLEDSMAIAHSDDVHTIGFTGAGIRVAVWEEGPDDTTNLVIKGFYDSSQSNTSTHARHTCGIIKNKERSKPHGHAKGCTLYSANDYALAALRWAVVDKNCTVISQSFHRDAEQTSSTLSFDDIYKDWLILHWPYPTILQAAGNGSSTEYVNHKGFNSLAVGNHDDSAGTMSGTSVFRNPSSSHGDRELPEIAANGTNVTTVGLTLSGTSMAAPAAAGCAALLQQVDNNLVHWPEGCRAILLAGARKNIAGNTWWNDVIANVDGVDGTGAVNVEESEKITESRRSRNSAGTQRGWDIGTLRSSDFGSNGLSKFEYKIKIPFSRLLSFWSIKVALAWNSKVAEFNLFGIRFPISSKLTLDFDLQIFDSSGNIVGYSGSWDNSYEIAEFAARAGETYTVRIRRWSGTDDSWYGIAWRASRVDLRILETAVFL